MINYLPAGQWALVVHALAIHESHENATAVGDGGRALGPLQQHPPFLTSWYTKAGPSNNDDWNAAFVRACAAYLTWAVPRFTLAGAVQAYNTGVSAYTKGVRNLVYLDGFVTAYKSLGGSIDLVPVGTRLRRWKGMFLRYWWDR